MDRFVGPYHIRRLINRGGQGSVYLGYDERLQRQVAIKVHALPDQRANRRALLREARQVALMDSPYTVQIYDVIESSTHLAMVMEYVHGCSLEDLLGELRPALSSILTVGCDVAGALAVARQHQLLHGDIKPANVLITTRGRARLADFGLSRPARDGGATRAGSLPAISPEQYAGEAVDGRADLFALGALLYRMVCGEHPFFRDGRLDATLLLAGTAPPLRQGITGDVELPAALEQIITRLLARDPQQRPRNTREVRQVLRGVMRDIPVPRRNTLAGEAQRCCRAQLPEDVPPRVPPSLGREARSRLPPRAGRRARWLHWLRGLHRGTQWLLGLVAVAALVAPAVVAWHQAMSTVRFTEPVFLLEGKSDLPAGMSSQWLLTEVRQSMQHHLGALEVVGPVGAPRQVQVLASEPRLWVDQAARHHVGMELRCVEALCVLELLRISGGERFSAQGVLFRDAGMDRWARNVRRTTAMLFSQPPETGDNAEL